MRSRAVIWKKMSYDSIFLKKGLLGQNTTLLGVYPKNRALKDYLCIVEISLRA